MTMPDVTRRDYRAMNAISETRNGVARVGNGRLDLSPSEAEMLVRAGLAITFDGTFSKCAELTKKGRDYQEQISERHIM